MPHEPPLQPPHEPPLTTANEPSRTSASPSPIPVTATIAAPPAGLRRWWPGWRNASCLLLLYAATVHLPGLNNGGRSLGSLLPALAISIPVVLAVAPTLAGSSARLRLISLAWAGGFLLALLFADVRAGWVLPAAAASLALPVFLAALHLLRTSWGAGAVFLVLALAGLRAWYWAGLVWFGGGSNHEGDPAWMALAWHNQSGTLMGALGVGAIGVAMVRTGPVQVFAILVAAAGLAGAWLSGSRGAAIVTLLGLLVLTGAALRRRPARSVAATFLVSTVLTLGGIAGLSAIYGGEGLSSQPVLSRTQEASQNAAVRIDYWHAALQMASSSPLVGTGPGSYRWAAAPFFPNATGLTASAHNEPLTAMVERGFLGGGAVLLVTLGLAFMSLRTILRPGSIDLDIAAAGVVTLLLAHATIDFDWNYPILLSFLAAAGAILVASGSPRDAGLSGDAGDSGVAGAVRVPGSPGDTEDAAHSGDSGDAGDVGAVRHASDMTGREGVPRRAGGTGPLDAATIAAALLLLITAGGGVLAESEGSAGVPWELEQRTLRTLAAAERGDHADAAARLATMRRWNPGAPRLDAIEGIVLHRAGKLTDEELVARVDAGGVAIPDQTRVVARLIEVGRTGLASRLLGEIRIALEGRARSRALAATVEGAVLMLEIARVDGGCQAAEAASSNAFAWASQVGVQDLVTLVRTQRPGAVPGWMGCGFAREAAFSPPATPPPAPPGSTPDSG